MAVSLPPSLLRRPIAESNQFYFSTWPDRSRACAIREKWYQYQPPTEKSFKYNALTLSKLLVLLRIPRCSHLDKIAPLLLPSKKLHQFETTLSDMLAPCHPHDRYSPFDTSYPRNHKRLRGLNIQVGCNMQFNPSISTPFLIGCLNG